MMRPHRPASSGAPRHRSTRSTPRCFGASPIIDIVRRSSKMIRGPAEPSAEPPADDARSRPSKNVLVAGDNPITAPTEDTLGRSAVAGSFVRHVLAIDASEGVVVAVLGPWGSGKTSFINLARPEFAEDGAAILDFNPWMFSGAQQLVDSFFVELAAQLRIRPGLDQIGKD